MNTGRQIQTLFFCECLVGNQEVIQLSENAESDLALADRPESGPFLSDRSGLVAQRLPKFSVCNLGCSVRVTRHSYKARILAAQAIKSRSGKLARLGSITRLRQPIHRDLSSPMPGSGPGRRFSGIAALGFSSQLSRTIAPGVRNSKNPGWWGGGDK